MQLIHVIAVLFLPMTILANKGDGYPGGHSGEVRPPHRYGKFAHSGFPTGGYPHGAGRPTGTGYPVGTGSPTRYTDFPGYPTGASDANHGQNKRNYPVHDKYEHGRGHGHDQDHNDGRPRWTNLGKHDGLKSIYPNPSSTGYGPNPTTGHYPTASSGYPVPTGRPSGGLRRRHPRMI